MPAMQLAIGLLWAASHGLGFDPGYGLELRLEHRLFEISGSATTEQKHDADGYTWNGQAILIYPHDGIRPFAGVSVHGYEADFGDHGWQKNDSVPVVGLEYKNHTFRIRAQYSFEDQYGMDSTIGSFEYAITKTLWFGAGYGKAGDGQIADVRLTIRP